MMRSLRSIVFTTLTTLVLVHPASWAQTSDFRLGTAIAASQAERSITIAADTRWVNVHQGELIRFVAGQAEFGWKFDGSACSFDLMRSHRPAPQAAADGVCDAGRERAPRKLTRAMPTEDRLQSVRCVAFTRLVEALAAEPVDTQPGRALQHQRRRNVRRDASARATVT